MLLNKQWIFKTFYLIEITLLAQPIIVGGFFGWFSIAGLCVHMNWSGGKQMILLIVVTICCESIILTTVRAVPTVLVIILHLNNNVIKNKLIQVYIAFAMKLRLLKKSHFFFSKSDDYSFIGYWLNSNHEIPWNSIYL